MGVLVSSILRLGAYAQGEVRHSTRRLPSLLLQSLIVVVWASVAVTLGAAIGLMAIILPPLYIFLFLLIVTLILLWALPDFPHTSGKLIRRLFFPAVVIALALPVYYAIAIPGFPFMTFRRAALAPLIALVAISYSASSQTRQRMASLVKDNRILAVCMFGYLAVSFAATPMSPLPASSISGLTEYTLEWYAPFVAVLYVLRSQQDVDKFVKIILCCALLISTIACVDAVIHKRSYVLVMPDAWKSMVAAGDPLLWAVFTGARDWRDGVYRVSSVYTGPLTLAEFEAMMIPLAAVFALHNHSRIWRAVGVIGVVACFVGIFVSGSRGGYVSAIVGLSVLTILWVLRTYWQEPQSFRAQFVGAVAAVGLVLLGTAIVFVPAVHNRVLGGGAEQASDDGRRTQWQMAWPRIFERPIIGWGVNTSGAVVGYHAPGADYPTIDSFVLGTLVEKGVLGLAAFFGAILSCVYWGGRRYITDPSWSGALMGGFASLFAAYFMYRNALNDAVNVPVMYFFVGAVICMRHFLLAAERQTATAPSSVASAAKLKPRARAVPAE